LSRRKFIAASSGLAGSAISGQAFAESLADVPPREDGADLSGHSERSKYVKIARIPEAGPGKRNVDPTDAINSKTPLDKLFGSLTPSDLHYERSHSGAPDLDPAKHRLLMHGMGRDGHKCIVSLQRATDLEHRREREDQQCSRLARLYSAA
jgi:sulfane dehydrogenase subunit SoxC